MSAAMDVLFDHVVNRAVLMEPRKKSPDWQQYEDNFLKENLGWITEDEIAAALGRTKTAVHLRWKRDLHLPAPSKNPDVITALQAAEMLGIDGHKIAHWVDMGLIPGRLMPGDRKIRLIRRVSLMVWACSPDNWVYFDIKKVNDPHLKRLLKLRADRWGDEWWSTHKAADYHHVSTSDVKRYIQMGRISSCRLPVSLGGRHENRKWSNHFVLKSQAIRLKFYHRSGVYKHPIFTARADAWLLKARDELGMTYVDIGRTMKIGKKKTSPTGGGTNPTISYRYHCLKSLAEKEQVSNLVNTSVDDMRSSLSCNADYFSTAVLQKALRIVSCRGEKTKVNVLRAHIKRTMKEDE